MKLQIKGSFARAKKQAGTSVAGKEWTKYEVTVIDNDGQELPITFFGENYDYLTKYEVRVSVLN
jgi:hypothetical protein